MNHFLQPPEKGSLAVTYAVAWVGYRFLKIQGFKAWVSGARNGAQADLKAEE
jgi:hypothetical protein